MRRPSSGSCIVPPGCLLGCAKKGPGRSGGVTWSDWHGQMLQSGRTGGKGSHRRSNARPRAVGRAELAATTQAVAGAVDRPNSRPSTQCSVWRGQGAARSTPGTCGAGSPTPGTWPPPSRARLCRHLHQHAWSEGNDREFLQRAWSLVARQALSLPLLPPPPKHTPSRTVWTAYRGQRRPQAHPEVLGMQQRCRKGAGGAADTETLAA